MNERPTATRHEHRSVSVVVPVLDGAATIEELHARLSDTLAGWSAEHELIIVDDGSRDDTWDRLVRLTERDPNLRAVRLARNSGHAAAIAAGFSLATGEIVAMIDADLETAPEDLPKLLAAVEAGADLASGRRNSTRRWERQLASRVFNVHARRLGVRLHDVGCGMNAMTARVAAEYVACGHLGRTLVKPYLYSFAREVVEVEVESRRPASSSLRMGDLVTLWFRFDILQRPLALSSVALWGVFGVLVAAVEAVLGVLDVGGERVTLLVGAVITLLLAVLLVTLSLTAGLALKSVTDREAPYYRIVDRVGRDAPLSRRAEPPVDEPGPARPPGGTRSA